MYNLVLIFSQPELLHGVKSLVASKNISTVTLPYSMEPSTGWSVRGSEESGMVPCRTSPTLQKNLFNSVET